VFRRDTQSQPLHCLSAHPWIPEVLLGIWARWSCNFALFLCRTMKMTAVPTTITNKTIKKATGMPTDNPTIKPKFDPPSPSNKHNQMVRIGQKGEKESNLRMRFLEEQQELQNQDHREPDRNILEIAWWRCLMWNCSHSPQGRHWLPQVHGMFHSDWIQQIAGRRGCRMCWMWRNSFPFDRILYQLWWLCSVDCWLVLLFGFEFWWTKCWLLNGDLA